MVAITFPMLVICRIVKPLWIKIVLFSACVFNWVFTSELEKVVLFHASAHRLFHACSYHVCP